MGIEILKTPQGASDAGMFNLPPTFDTQKYAAEWVEESQVAYKKQRQNLPGCNATADGWEIWKNDKMDAPTIVSGSGNKKFVLMCRSAKVQKDVNALYGNVSKKKINEEVKGVTAAGAALQDPGMLSEPRLQQVMGKDHTIEESVLPENELETAPTT